MTVSEAAALADRALAYFLDDDEDLRAAVRVLIDRARAAAPVLDGDDRAGLRRWIADQVVDLIGGDFALAAVIGDSLVDDIGRTIERALDTSPAPSVAAPPREDREALIPSIEAALFGTTDGDLLDDEDASVPVGEFRRLLREVWAGTGRDREARQR